MLPSPEVSQDHVLHSLSAENSIRGSKKYFVIIAEIIYLRCFCGAVLQLSMCP